MRGFKIPLNFSPGNFYHNNRVDEKESIKNFIKLLVGSPNGSFKPNSRFGFSLKNHHFENVDSKGEIDKKKVAEENDTPNTDTYAKELQDTIKDFEHRLKDLKVRIKYDNKKSSEEDMIIISGKIEKTNKEVSCLIPLYIWKNYKGKKQ